MLGGAEGIRTPYLCDANAALSQMSYSPSTPSIAREQGTKEQGTRNKEQDPSSHDPLPVAGEGAGGGVRPQPASPCLTAFDAISASISSALYPSSASTSRVC